MKHRFEAALEPPGFVKVPAGVMSALGPRKRVPVKVTINGFTWSSTIAVYGGEGHIPVRAEVRARARASLGDRLRVALERDDVPRAVDVPADLDKALRAARLRVAFDAFSFTHQNEYVRWIEEAKRPETRATRIAKTVDATREKAAAPKG